MAQTGWRLCLRGADRIIFDGNEVSVLPETHVDEIMRWWATVVAVVGARSLTLGKRVARLGGP